VAIVMSVKIFFIVVWILFDLTFDGAKVGKVFPSGKKKFLFSDREIPIYVELVSNK